MSEVFTYEDPFVTSQDRGVEWVEDAFDTFKNRQELKDSKEGLGEDTDLQIEPEVISVREQILRDIGGLDGELSPDSSGSARSDYFDGKELFHENGESITKVVEETCSPDQIEQHHAFLEYLKGGSKETFIFQWPDETFEGEVLKLSVATIGENGVVNYEPWIHRIVPEVKEDSGEEFSDLDEDEVLVLEDLDLNQDQYEEEDEGEDGDQEILQEIEPEVSVNEEIEQKLQTLFVETSESIDVQSEISAPEFSSIADLLLSTFGYSPELAPSNTEIGAREFSSEVSNTVIPEIQEQEFPDENGEVSQVESQFQQSENFSEEIVFLKSDETEESNGESGEKITIENVVLEKTAESTTEISINEPVFSEPEQRTATISKEEPQISTTPEIYKQEIIIKDNLISIDEVRTSINTTEINLKIQDKVVSRNIELITDNSIYEVEVSNATEVFQIKPKEISNTIEPIQFPIRENTAKGNQEPVGIRLVTTDKTKDNAPGSELSEQIIQVKNEKTSKEPTNEILRVIDSALVDEVKRGSTRMYAPEHFGPRSQGVFYLGDDAQVAANDNRVGVVRTRDGITMRIAA